MNNNERKSALLGMPFGTATNKLRKMLLYKLAEQLDLLDCYRCKGYIDNIDQFSIEHKVSWMNADDPVEAFFDLGQIAFSHLVCNVGAGNRPNKIYESAVEQNRQSFKRYYGKNSEAFLRKKRARYHANKAGG